MTFFYSFRINRRSAEVLFSFVSSFHHWWRLVFTQLLLWVQQQISQCNVSFDKLVPRQHVCLLVCARCMCVGEQKDVSAQQKNGWEMNAASDLESLRTNTQTASTHILFIPAIFLLHKAVHRDRRRYLFSTSNTCTIYSKWNILIGSGPLIFELQ